jgi:hypothetical protein
MATSWADVQWEAMFKRVEGGFIFRTPGFFPRHFLVTEVQKAEIIREGMRAPFWPGRRFPPKPKRFLLTLSLVLGLVVLAFALEIALQRLWTWGNGFDKPHSREITPTWVILIIVFLVPPIQGAVMTRTGQIGRILREAHRTEQRISLRERNKAYALLSPLSTLLTAGVAPALGCAFFAMISFGVTLGPLQFGQNPQNQLDQIESWFVLVLLAVFAVRFFYLAILKLALGKPA